ncbi:phosphoribosyltransferase [Fodinibius saliphilus]|uniref:phosphoribosyltransferase n=1 Tax=Fodinibius saliphilus TaxID=1920650 RepID=UPI001108030A|nr:phosphoribosyltransferase family protein [Fodinibius saliphilus]
MFIDRKDAGNKLGQALEKYQHVHPLVLGIPRGGVEVGYYVAIHLKCDFDVVIVRKLGYPCGPEAAFGAIAEDGSLYLNPWSNKYLNKEIIEQVVKKERQEIRRRINEYRKKMSLPDLADRVVILVDDGIATGSTIFAALSMCQKQEPKKLVVAAPVSGTDRLMRLEDEADEVIILDQREKFFAVSEGYQRFTKLTDNEVIHFMELWRKKRFFMKKSSGHK